jgi:formate hydrogenlyase subunit 3/multisubunit Na+/H+ antiporter MnhD subunit
MSAVGLMAGLMPGLMLLTLLLPPALMLVCGLAGRGDGPRWVLPLASLPALVLGGVVLGHGVWGLDAVGPLSNTNPSVPTTPDHGASLQLPALLLATQLRVDALAATLLVLIGLAWSAAGWFAASRLKPHWRTFALVWLATLSGLQLATLAGDVATFYTGYVTMTFAAYGLVLHERNAASQRAGRVYLVLALLGEALLLSGLLLFAAGFLGEALAALGDRLEQLEKLLQKKGRDGE